MGEDAYCLFVIVACLLTLAMPDAGQVILAVFMFALAVLARLAPDTDSHGHRPDHDRHDLAGR